MWQFTDFVWCLLFLGYLGHCQNILHVCLIFLDCLEPFLGIPITKDLQLRFMENLLSTYREMERTFMESVYELYKAFKFRTLWEGENPLAEFQRVASESAHGTGRLNGMIQLTEVLQNMEKLEITAVKCFTDNIYADDVKKWSFDKDKHQEVRIITILTLISTTPDKAPP